MDYAYPKSKRFYEIVISLLGWFAIIAQFYLQINSERASITELIIRFFSYFTILTNILVALSCLLQLLAPGSAWGRFFSRSTTLTAITVYIVIVGVVYNIILRATWNPEGLQMIVDEILHSIIPLFFLLYWIFFVNKAALKWSQVFPWLLYPLIYAVYIMVRGYFSGFYPYPFVDVDQLGWRKATVNAVGFTVLFFVTSLFLVSAGRLFSGRSKIAEKSERQ